MTSLAAAEEPLPGVRGNAFFGFPLHAAGRPSAERGEHLRRVGLPMLFLQGTRDDLVDLSLLRSLLERVTPPPTVHVVDGADHRFRVPTRRWTRPGPPWRWRSGGRPLGARVALRAGFRVALC